MAQLNDLLVLGMSNLLGAVNVFGDITAPNFIGSGASLTSLNASNISSGTLAVARLATSGVTAGTYGPSANVSGSNGATITVPQFTVDQYGRVTSVTNRTYTAVDHTYTVNNATITIAAGNGLTTGGDFTTNQSSNETITLNVGAGTGISVTADAVALATVSGLTAGSYGPSANATPGYGSTFNVPYITVDAYGRVTSISTKTVKIPASDNTNTTYSLSGALSGNTFVTTLTPSSGSATTATTPAMSAATASAAGKAGLVPAPAAGAQAKMLLGNGTWSDDYVSNSDTGVQCIAGGLVVGATSTSGLSGTGVGRIMFTGQANPLIGVQAVSSDGTKKTPYYFQAVASDDCLYLGPTSSSALKFDSSGNMTSPATLTLSGLLTATGGVKTNIIQAPTSSGGSTYGTGSSGQVLKSNGSTIYWANDSNSDTKVTQTVTTSNAAYPLLLAPNGQTATATTTSYFDSGVTLNPSTNTIAANISGNAATATALGTNAGAINNPVYFTGGKPAATIWTVGNQSYGEHNCNNVTYNFSGYYTSNGPAQSLGATTDDGSLWAQAYSATWVTQIAQDYRNGNLFVRGKNNGTWQSWRPIPSGAGTANYIPKFTAANQIGNSAITDDGSKVNIAHTTLSIASKVALTYTAATESLDFIFS